MLYMQHVANVYAHLSDTQCPLDVQHLLPAVKHLGRFLAPSVRAGNSFCGTVPYEFDGVLRNYVGDDGRYQVLANVTALNATCAPDHAGTIGTAAFAATVGKFIYFKTLCLIVDAMQSCSAASATALLCVPLCLTALRRGKSMAERAQSLGAVCRDFGDLLNAMQKGPPTLVIRQHSQVHVPPSVVELYHYHR